MEYIEFGEGNDRVYPSDRNYEPLITRALRARGYDRVEVFKSEGGSWIKGSSGFAVYRVDGKGGRSLIFLANESGTAAKVVAALKMTTPTGDFEKELVYPPK